MITAENQRNRKLLNAIRMKVLTDSSQRYVTLAKDYLQASLSGKAGGLIQVVDRNNEVNDGIPLVLTAYLGDREEDSQTVPVAGATKVKTVVYTQPYVGKVRDLNGNVITAFKGTAKWSVRVNNIVESKVSDPARKLVEAVCDQIADKLLKALTRNGAETIAGSVIADDEEEAEDDERPAKRRSKVQKWLVLDKMTYQTGVDRLAFEGVDKLLLTKLVQANKYKCLDRDMYDTAAREEGFGGKAELIPAGYAMSGEIVQLQKSGKTRMVGGDTKAEYIATVSIRANDLKTQRAYEADTFRVSAYCQTPKDMLVHVVKRTALAILMRDYPLYIMDIEDDEITLSYGKDFLEVGQQYEVRRRKEIIDDDTGETVYKEKTIGVCEVTDCGKNTSTAKLISGKAKEKNVLRFYENAEPFAVAEVVAAPAEKEVSASPLPAKKPRIAVAPFISKRHHFSIWGTSHESRNWMDDLADHLNIHLTQCGSFKTLDRSFGPEIDRELNNIVKDPNANPKDICRLSNKLATDYLVVADVVFSDVASPGTDFVTGLPKPPLSAQFAEIRFRCVMAPTTQIAWAETLRIDSKMFYGTPEVFSSTSAEWAAANIAAIIQSRLDPKGFAVRQTELKKAAEAAAAAAPAPVAAPAPSQGINVGF